MVTTQTHEIDSVTLERICEEQGEPFQWLARATETLRRPLKSLSGVTEMSIQSGAMYCGRVREAIVFGKSYVKDSHARAAFAHQSHRNYLPKEFAHYYREQVIEEERPRPYIAEECCFLGGYSGDTKFFGHFIYEFLFRLPAFERCGLLDKFPLAVYEGVPESWLSFIELFGVPRDRFLKVPHHPAPKFRSVWVTSAPIAAWIEGYAFWDDGIMAVRRKLLMNAAPAGSVGPKRIFIGRRDTAHRRLLNEDEVWRYLEGQGFNYVEFAGKTAAEQVNLMRSAEIVVAVIGSATALTHFAPTDSIIVGILPAHMTGVFGPMGIAAVLGQTYDRLPRAVSGDWPKEGANADFTVALSDVKQVVEKAIDLKESQHSASKSLQSPN